jgi:thiosulfate reductase cytochrome b subunit
MSQPTAVATGQEMLLVRDAKAEHARTVLFEHPYAVRLTHWVSAISITVMILSGIAIFRAFPSFGPKIPQSNLVTVPRWLGLGGWLGGGLQWHLSFMWPLMIVGVWYVVYQIFSGNYRQVLFARKDIGGVWPMARHYFLFGPKPELKESYNPLQKLAYTSAILFGVVAVATGLVLYKPVQLSSIAWLMGGFRFVRIWWNNFYSMLIGWKSDPEHMVAVAAQSEEQPGGGV